MERDRSDIMIPADVPPNAENEFLDNITLLTHDTNRLLLFVADHKLEHLNKDFYGPNIDEQALDPQHIFEIASQSPIGALATHPGLIARYARYYPDIPYVVKLTARTHLSAGDPHAASLMNVEQVIEFKEESKLPICGVGISLYLGSSFESDMLAYASHAIYQAHLHGLVAIVWAYTRGSAVSDETDPQLIAGVAGAAAALGADFVKIKPPHEHEGRSSAQWLAIATASAGTTNVICSGGSTQDPERFLKTVDEQLRIGNTAGLAVGRNLFQRPIKQAVALADALSVLIYDGGSLQESYTCYREGMSSQ